MKQLQKSPIAPIPPTEECACQTEGRTYAKHQQLRRNQGLAIRIRSLAILIIGCAAISCSKPQKSLVDEQDNDFRQISRAYSVAISMTHKPPSNLEKIREILADLHQAKLGEAPDDVLTSSRDGQPYVIVLGVPLGQELGSEIFIYEKSGAGGNRYVMTVGRVVKQLTDGEFAQSTFPKGHQPEKN